MLNKLEREPTSNGVLDVQLFSGRQSILLNLGEPIGDGGGWNNLCMQKNLQFFIIIV